MSDTEERRELSEDHDLKWAIERAYLLEEEFQKKHTATGNNDAKSIRLLLKAIGSIEKGRPPPGVETEGVEAARKVIAVMKSIAGKRLAIKFPDDETALQITTIVENAGKVARALLSTSSRGRGEGDSGSLAMTPASLSASTGRPQVAAGVSIEEIVQRLECRRQMYLDIGSVEGNVAADIVRGCIDCIHLVVRP